MRILVIASKEMVRDAEKARKEHAPVLPAPATFPRRTPR